MLVRDATRSSTFSVKHLLMDLQQQQQQDHQHVDDTEVSQATEVLTFATHDDPLMLVGIPPGACLYYY